MNITELQFWSKNEVWVQNKNKTPLKFNTQVPFTKKVPSTFAKSKAKAYQQFVLLQVFPTYFSTIKAKVKHCRTSITNLQMIL